MTRIVLALVAALVSTVPAGAMTREQRSELRRLIAEQVDVCRVNAPRASFQFRGPIFIEYHAGSLADVPASLWGPEYRGPLFNIHKPLPLPNDGVHQWHHGFFSISLRPDGWLAEEPKVITYEWHGQVLEITEQEAKLPSQQAWIGAIKQCAPYRIPAAYADSYAEWKTMTCVLLGDKDEFVPQRVRGRHPCEKEQ